jgi:hypothetical protein
LYEGRKLDADLEIWMSRCEGCGCSFISARRICGQTGGVLDIVLMIGPRPIIINTPAEVLRIGEANRRFEVVFLYTFELCGSKKHGIEYIAKRQMVLNS